MCFEASRNVSKKKKGYIKMKKILSIAASAVLLAGSAVGIAPRKANATTGCAPEDVYDVTVVYHGYYIDGDTGLYKPYDRDSKSVAGVDYIELGKFESCANDYAADRAKVDEILGGEMAKRYVTDGYGVIVIEDDEDRRSTDGCTQIFNVIGTGLVHEVEIEDEE